MLMVHSNETMNKTQLQDCDVSITCITYTAKRRSRQTHAQYMAWERLLSFKAALVTSDVPDGKLQANSSGYDVRYNLER